MKKYALLMAAMMAMALGACEDKEQTPATAAAPEAPAAAPAAPATETAQPEANPADQAEPEKK